MILLLSGCGAPQVSQAEEQINISITADGKSQAFTARAGLTVEEAIAAAGITLDTDDETDPPRFATLSDGDSVRVIRVNVEDKLVQEPEPYSQQYVRSEYIPEDEERVIQAGEEGLTEYTLRTTYKDGVKVKEERLNPVEIKLPVPQIIAIGAQSSFARLQIPGKLAYISGGNAWIMESSIGSKRAVITSGDLDGRILSISPDGNWLLFTRKSKKPAAEEINTLWVASLTGEKVQEIDLEVSNIIHYAGFAPFQTKTIAYSTVEPRATPPGWQANNDLYFVRFRETNQVGKPVEIIPANAGGVYGWWGTNYVWAPDGKTLAYTRPDGIGLVENYNSDEPSIKPLLDIVPLQTGSDWTLIPGLAFGADSTNLYVVTHAPPPGLVSPEESPYFNLTALSLANSTNVNLVQQSGMFAYPAVSSARQSGGQTSYLVAYLQAIFPAQSDTSRYRLVVMDRDGSNRQTLFPAEGSTGLDPQTPVWAPAPVSAEEGDFISVVYKGNVWLVDVATGNSYQVTGDGLVTRVDWK